MKGGKLYSLATSLWGIEGEVFNSGLIQWLRYEGEPAPFDVRSHSTFRRCSLQFKRGSTIIGGIPFDIKCLAFVTLSSTFQLSGNGRKSRSFFLLLISFLSLPSSFFFSPFLPSSSSFFFYKTSRRKRTRTTRFEGEDSATFYENVFHYTSCTRNNVAPTIEYVFPRECATISA